jgi:hypothetical protein
VEEGDAIKESCDLSSFPVTYTNDWLLLLSGGDGFITSVIDSCRALIIGQIGPGYRRARRIFLDRDFAIPAKLCSGLITGLNENL